MIGENYFPDRSSLPFDWFVNNPVVNNPVVNYPNASSLPLNWYKMDEKINYTPVLIGLGVLLILLIKR